MKILTCVVGVLAITLSFATNNVCRSFAAYNDMLHSRNCYFNPDIEASPWQIAKRYGYRLDEHRVKTKDGYILGIHRVSKSGERPSGKPIFMQHGFTHSSRFWLLNGKTSVPFYLVDNGYDIWLGNARGNDYSTSHVKYGLFNRKFWDFSFHEMALYDLPAIMDYISEKTCQRGNITYIGHSMGTTMSYIYSMTLANHAKLNIDKIISLAPVAYSEHFNNWISESARGITRIITEDLFKIGMYGSGQAPVIQMSIKEFCKRFVLICYRVLSSVVGPSKQVEPDIVPAAFVNYPAGFSFKTALHFLQLIMSNGTFQQFNYGAENNMLRYKSASPPKYNVGNIRVPVHLIYGKNDFLVKEKDVWRLYNELNSPKSITSMEINETSFNHNDFLYGKNLILFNTLLLNIIR